MNRHLIVGRFGDAVVVSNMTVMNEGFARVTEIKYGGAHDADRSSMRNPLLKPIGSSLLQIAAGAGTGTIKFFIAIIIAGFLYSPAPLLADAIRKFSRRLASRG